MKEKAKPNEMQELEGILERTKQIVDETQKVLDRIDEANREPAPTRSHPPRHASRKKGMLP